MEKTMQSELTYTVPAYEGARTDMAVADGGDLMGECLDAYGWRREMLMAAEECSELIQASTKLQRCEGDEVQWAAAMDHLAEEMADVRIMLAQLTVMFDLDGQVAGWVERKLDRQRARLRAIA